MKLCFERFWWVILGLSGLAGSQPRVWADSRRHWSFFAFWAQLLLGPQDTVLA